VRTRTTQEKREPAKAPALAPPPTLAQAILSLQRTGGNRAATRFAHAVLARSAPAASAKPAPGGDEPSRWATAGQRLVDDWDALRTPERRAQVLVQAAEDQLRALDVPPADYSPDRAPGEGELDAPAGVFLFKTWTMHVEERRFDGPAPPYKTVRDLAVTVGHETRHCQQWFWMARYLAGTDAELDAAEIAESMGIPEPIARRARRAPLLVGDAAFEEAKGWYESVYGTGAEHRREVLRKLDAAEVWYRVAKAKLDSAAPQDRPAAQREFDAARKERSKWFDAYEQLATEADARAVGEKVGVSLDQMQAP
jgi:hypothetical protein